MESEEDWLGIAARQEDWILPVKDDLAQWINRTLEIEDVTADNFMNVLDDGVLVCRLARLIYEKGNKEVPPFKFKCWANAKRGTFFARDNVHNFLRWCKRLGVNESVIFESDGLVLQTQVRRVVLCLLELGRISSRIGIDPPGIVKLEREIDEELDVDESIESDGTASSTATTVSDPDRRSSFYSKKGRLSELDKRIMQISDNWWHRVRIRQLSEGKYLIGGKIVFIRLLNGRHVMVRVGGGWDTLEHYVANHDPSYDTSEIFLNQPPNPRGKSAKSNGTMSVAQQPRPQTAPPMMHIPIPKTPTRSRSLIRNVDYTLPKCNNASKKMSL